MNNMIFFKVIITYNNQNTTSIVHRTKNPLLRTSEHNHIIELPEFLIFSRFKKCFYQLQIFFLIETGCSLLDFDVIFPMQSSKFTK